MKHSSVKRLLVCLILICCVFGVFAQNSLPFSKGIDMLTWFETWQEALPPLNKHDESDFAMLKSMGVDVVRLPVHFELVMEPLNTGVINETVLKKLDEVCDWAEKYQIYLVIDDHSFNSEAEDNNPPTSKLYKEHLESVWSQVAQRYKDRSEYIIYEILNEPKAKGDISAKWNKIQQDIIDVIRSYDPNRTIVVTSSNFSSIDTLVKMKPYKDPNLIYTFHFYEPSTFTHQGATWIGVGFSDIKIPFPYDKSRLPQYKGETLTWGQLKQEAIKIDSWMQYAIDTYPNEGTVKYINNRIKKVADWAKKNKVRIWAGEMGVHYSASPEDRTTWIKTVRTAFEENNIPYCVWGIDGYFGFLKYGSSESFPEDIDKEILEAEGFSMPDTDIMAKVASSLNDFPKKPYTVYDGLCGKKTRIAAVINCQTLIKDDEAHTYCLKAPHIPAQSLFCNFLLPHAITTKVAEYEKSLALSFSVKFTDKNQWFDIYLQDTDEGEANLPWRKAYTVKASDYPLNKWVSVEIPISDFKNSWGTWSNKTSKWYDRESQFEWSRFQTLYFNFEDWENKKTGDIYIDDVVIKQK